MSHSRAIGNSEELPLTDATIFEFIVLVVLVVVLGFSSRTRTIFRGRTNAVGFRSTLSRGQAFAGTKVFG